jgi:hypothetical protein
MPISKVEAAGRQLQVAIELFFSGGDPIAVATLAYNALEISATLASMQGKLDWTAFDDIAQRHGSTAREVHNIFHAPRNFFKHADRDPDELLDRWTEDDAAHLLALTVLQFGEIEERSVEMWSALIWYYATHPELPPPAGNLAEIVTEFAYIGKMPAEMQRAARTHVLAELRSRALE